MSNRRHFLQSTLLGSAGVFLGKKLFGSDIPYETYKGRAMVVSTWAPNAKANAAAWEVLKKGGRALDAVEAGAKIPEADPEDQSVGLGGLPDRDGRVTLDACIMDNLGNCGSVMCLEHIIHAISVARLVMEKTPHVQLVGEGALRFALSQGFKKENLLTPSSEKAWREWLKTSKYDPMISVENINEKIKNRNNIDQTPGGINNHDTIGMVAMDMAGQLSGACTTSGMAYKMHGRVGDSPIIGAGLFVDNEVGAATATGVGEEVVRICGAHSIVELMRQGLTPAKACKEAVQRMVRKNAERAKTLQVGFLCINKKGEVGAYALQKNFSYVVQNSDGGSKVFEAESYFK